MWAQTEVIHSQKGTIFTPFNKKPILHESNYFPLFLFRYISSNSPIKGLLGELGTQYQSLA